LQVSSSQCVTRNVSLSAIAPAYGVQPRSNTMSVTPNAASHMARAILNSLVG
jgi:hypothetical protein